MRKYIMLYLITLGLAQPVHAAVFHIASGDVAGLINAINTANSNGQDNTINLAAGTYTLTAVNNDTNGPNGLPSVTGNITIKGANAPTTVIQRGANAPGFRIFHIASTGDLTLNGITITGGQQPTEGGASGGGILNDGGKLSIIDSTISDNDAMFNDGGGVSSGGSTAITNSIISGNQVTLTGLGLGPVGGGIHNEGTMTISKSTISGNRANFGGGISNSGNLTIDDSEIGGNFAVPAGGGIENVGTLTIDNTTISGNGTLDEGAGGIFNNGGAVTLTNSTIAENTGGCIAQGSGPGGGIANLAGIVELQNTILAENTTVLSCAPGPDCFGIITSLGNNIIGDTSGCTITLQATDLTGDPGLGTFTDNGTPGNGHFPLLPDSQAINAGNNNVCLSNPILHTDQIGDPRVGICDIGSIEELKVVGKGFLFTILDVPGSTFTQAFGINSSGQIVGSFLDSSGVTHGFLRNKKGNFTTIDVPDSTSTDALGINPSGQIVGTFEDSTSGIAHGFLLDKKGNFTTIDVPGSTFTEAFGISPSGQIVGFSRDSSGVFHGFLLNTKGNFTIIDVPGSTFTQAFGINSSGQIVGSFEDSIGVTHGFLLNTKGNFTILDVPGSTFTQASGINPSRQIVGSFEDSRSVFHGFLLDKKGNFTTIDVPDSTSTDAFGINPSGRIVGSFDDFLGVHGFLACPSKITASSLSTLGPCS